MTTAGLAASSAATSGAAARTCSQLSRSSSSRLSARKPDERLRAGAGPTPLARRAWRQSSARRGRDRSAARDRRRRRHRDSDRGLRRRSPAPAASCPSRPVRSGSPAALPASSSARIAATSSSRPMRAVGGMARLVGCRGRALQRRELVRQPWRDHLKDLFRLLQIPQAVGAERAQAHVRPAVPLSTSRSTTSVSRIWVPCPAASRRASRLSGAAR